MSMAEGDAPMRAVCVGAARPNFMKVKPVLDALERRDVETVLVHTGQHYDEKMSQVFFDELGMRAPDHHLGVGSGTHAAQTAGVMVEFEQLVSRVRPDVVVVFGDVNSTVACALVAAKAGVRVAHVEAGLRSRDWDMPEEINRVVTDRLSDVLFAPSEDAVGNLHHEGYRADQVHLVGNVMIDTLLANVDRARARTVRADLDLPERYGVATLHRPSNVDDPATLARLMGALGEIAEGVPVVLPVHPRAQARLASMELHPRIRLVEPLGYLDFLCLLADAAVVLTDSGGVQEETTALGVPCLTLRENTERPVTVDHGTNQVVGTDPARITEVASRVLSGGVESRCPSLWDGKASDRIADVLVDRLAGIPRPTELAS